MKILVTTATRHGTTTRVGDAVADQLQQAGHEVVRHEIGEQDEVEQVLPLAGVDAVVLGGSVYTGAWLTRATRAQSHLLSRGIRTYAFAVGVLDVASDPAQPRWTSPRTRATQSERVVFGGAIRREALSLRERSLLAVVRAQEGDYTDWDGVRAWASAVAADLAALSPA